MPTDWAVGVYASTPNDVFMVGSGGTIARWDGAKWTTVKTSSTWASITGTSANDVWIGGAGIASHWDGSSWTDRTMDGNVDALTSTSADDVHAAVTVAGEAKILRFDGTAWTLAGTLPAGTQVRRLWAAAKDDVWATTTKGVLRWTGGPWSNVLPAATASRGVFGTGPADVWIVQDRGIIEHWNGASWFGVDAGTTAYLFDGFATHDDVWVVGSGNAILHHTR
jgi:hypothetical protein